MAIIAGLRGQLSGSGTLNGTLQRGSGMLPPYEGSYEVTPTQSTQILNTENRSTMQDIVINPIPTCYGLVEQIGVGLRIS